jgi:hypothetical protein
MENVSAGTGISVSHTPSEGSTATISTNDSAIVHDNLNGYVANEHIDWTIDQGAINIHAGNYTDTNQLTTFVIQDGDTTNVTIDQGKYVKFQALTNGGLDIDWASPLGAGSVGDPYDLQFKIDLSNMGALVDTLESGDNLLVYNADEGTALAPVSEIQSALNIPSASGTTDGVVTLNANGTLTGEANLTFDGTNLDLAGNLKLTTNATYLYSKDASGNSPRMFGMNVGNNTYIGPIDAYAGGSILYGTSSNVVDQIFYTSGSERLRIKATTGNVGIGQVSPGYKLDVSGNVRFTSDLRNEARLLNSVGSAASPSYSFFSQGNAGMYRSGDGVGFSAAGSSVYDINSTRMYINTNVGIGTTSPTFSYGSLGLEIQSTGDTSLRLERDGSTAFEISARSSDILLYNPGTARAMRFGIGGTEAMRIDTSRNVLIGRTSAFSSARVEIQNDATEQLTLNNVSTDGKMLSLYNSGSIVGGLGNDVTELVIYQGTTEAMRIDSSQNVGIGTQSPQSKLEAKTAIDSINTILSAPLATIGDLTPYLNYQDLEFRNNYVNTTGTAKVRLRHHSNLYVNSGSQFSIATSTTGGTITEALRVDHSQRVGIGTTSPGALLDVGGRIKLTSSGVLQWGASANYGNLTWDGDSAIVQGQSGKDLDLRSGSSRNILFKIGGSEKARIDSSGNVGIGTSSPAEKLDVNGNIRIGNGGGLFVEHSSASVGGTVIHPNGGTFRTNSSAFTGAIKITLPTGTGTIADMVSFWVDVFDYTTNESFTCYIAGYAYQTAGSNEWVNEEALILSANENRDFVVRFGHDGSNHCVYIGELTSAWNYPQITIRNVQIGFSSDVDTYNDGWSIGFESSAFQNVDHTQTDNFPYAKGLKSSSNMGAYIDGNEKFRFTTGGAFHASDDVVAFSTTPSDIKLKTNVKDIEYGLDTIMKLNPKQYDWKKDNRKDIGFIAQEVEEVIPEIVKDNEWFDDKIKTMDYEKLTAVLIKAVQEQQKQIEELKNG